MDLLINFYPSSKISRFYKASRQKQDLVFDEICDFPIKLDLIPCGSVVRNLFLHTNHLMDYSTSRVQLLGSLALMNCSSREAFLGQRKASLVLDGKDNK